MKNSIALILILNILSTFITGCSSVMKCTVSGTPGSKIYTTGGSCLGTIPPSGECEVKIERKDRRHDFLLTQQTPDSPIIPIGLSYDKRNESWFRNTVAFVFGIPLLSIPIVAWTKYIDRYDVWDGIKLCKRQNSNHDMANMIANASNPIDEIKAIPIKEQKKAKNAPTHKSAKSKSTAKGTGGSLSPSSEDFTEYTEEFFFTPQVHSIKSYVHKQIALISNFERGVYKYDQDEKFFVIKPKAMTVSSSDGKDHTYAFSPRIETVTVVTENDDVPMSMILYNNEDDFSFGIRAIRYNDGRIALHVYQKNGPTGKYIHTKFYELYY